MPRTKIVCTIGPASRSPETLEQLIQAGMDVARLNFSHGTQAEHLDVVTAVRRIAARLGRPIAILQDLAGLKIRIAEVASTEPEPSAPRWRPPACNVGTPWSSQPASPWGAPE